MSSLTVGGVRGFVCDNRGMTEIRSKLLWGAIALCAAVAGFWLARELHSTSPQLASGTWFPQARELREFTLTDQAGRPLTLSSLEGRPTLVFFGFTHCPDVCPRAMDQFAGAMDALGDDASLVQPILVTVDPERDTPQVLADYVAPFNAAGANIVGLTGTPEEIAAVETLYRAYARKVETGEGDYTMDHSAIIYLMGPDGGFLTLFDGSDAPDAMAAEIAAAIDEHS